MIYRLIMIAFMLCLHLVLLTADNQAIQELLLFNQDFSITCSAVGNGCNCILNVNKENTVLENNKSSQKTDTSWSEFSFTLKPSPLGGIGVFAAHDITAGTALFTQPFRLRTLKANEVPKEFIKYCIFINNEECVCPERFDRMEIGWYINHSYEPNIAHTSQNAKNTCVDKARFSNDFKVRSLYAIKDIKAGDEILIDYNYLDEPEYLKEDYYKPAKHDKV